MPSEPRWLDAVQLIAINEALVALTGEPHQVRDLGLLESAAAKPPENSEAILLRPARAWRLAHSPKTPTSGPIGRRWDPVGQAPSPLARKAALTN